MNAIQKCLKRLPDTPLGLLVHVHPTGAEVLRWVIGRGAQKVVLVTGEAQTAQELRNLAAGQSHIEVIDAVVANRQGSVRWSRYNLPEINGELKPIGLHQVFPRLQLLEQAVLDAVDFSTLLGRVGSLPHGTEPNLLVLESPGSELALLASVPQKSLRLFDWILLRTAREGLYTDASTLAEAKAHLAGRLYRLEAEDRQTEPLWPTALFRFDEAAAARQEALAQLDELRQQLSHAELRRVEDVKAATLERDAQLHLAQDRQKELAELKTALNTSMAAAAEQGSKLERAAKAKDEHAIAARDSAAKVEALSKEVASALELARKRQDELQQLTLAGAQSEAQVRDVQAQLTELEKALDAAKQLAKIRTDEVAKLTQARDDQTKALQEVTAKFESASESLGDLKKIAEERAAQMDQLTKGKDEQNKRAVDGEAKLQALTHSKGQADKLSAERQATIEQLTKARDEYSKLATERLKRITLLDTELTDVTARFAMLQEELIKAEAHVELIADLLFREPAR